MIEFQVDDQSQGVWDSLAKSMALAAMAMVLKNRAGEKAGAVVQEVRIAKDLPRISGMPRINGHVDPDTLLITLNASALAGIHFDEPCMGENLYARIVLTAAHEAEHVAQSLRGRILPDDETCIKEQGLDPWYEEEARQTAMDVLKGLYPDKRGGLPMGPNQKIYYMPEQSSYVADWQRLRAGEVFWTEKKARLGEYPKVSRKAGRTP